MARVIKKDCEWYELRGAEVRVARHTRDCDMAEHKDGWQGAIQRGDTYAWMSHGLAVCRQHFSDEDVTDA